MSAALIALGWVLAYLYVFWLLYVLIMGFYRAWLAKKLTTAALVLASPAIAIGLVADLLANWTIAVIWFRELPKVALSWPPKPKLPDLVTDRLSRYKGLPDGNWKKTHATWICQNLLDYFDPHETHCVVPSEVGN